MEIEIKNILIKFNVNTYVNIRKNNQKVNSYTYDFEINIALILIQHLNCVIPVLFISAICVVFYINSTQYN